MMMMIVMMMELAMIMMMVMNDDVDGYVISFHHFHLGKQVILYIAYYNNYDSTLW